MSTIFLDIDGVLVTRASLRLPGAPFRFDAACVDRLNRIVRDGGVTRIVISSSWRPLVTDDRAFEILLAVGGVDPHGWTLARTPHVPARRFSERVPRSAEIRAYLKAHGDGMPRVVIDDDGDANLRDGRFVHTDTEDGLSDADVARAIGILRRPLRAKRTA